jgi:site-specific DNA recombinase
MCCCPSPSSSARSPASASATRSPPPRPRACGWAAIRRSATTCRLVHKDQSYPGEHPAIIEQDLFDRVQQHLDGNARRHKATTATRRGKALLVGKLFDASGEPMSPTTARGKSGKVYRYYVSSSVQQGRATDTDRLTRLSASAIERLACEAMTRWLPEEREPLACLLAVHVTATGIGIELTTRRPRLLSSRLDPDEELVITAANTCTVHLPWRSGRDSNPRYAFDVYTLSRRAPSTTRPPLRAPCGCGRGRRVRRHGISW